MNSKRWQEQFQDELKTFESSKTALPPGKSELAVILEQQIINEEVYLHWAQRCYELPLLKLSYFAEHPMQRELWDKWKDHFAWNAQCVPVGEWEGHLFVACLEPQSFPENSGFIQVLCPLEGLQKTWSLYSSQTPLNLEASASSVSHPVSEEESSSPEGLSADVQEVDLSKMEGLLAETQADVRLEKIALDKSAESPLHSENPEDAPLEEPTVKRPKLSLDEAVAAAPAAIPTAPGVAVTVATAPAASAAPAAVIVEEDSSAVTTTSVDSETSQEAVAVDDSETSGEASAAPIPPPPKPVMKPPTVHMAKPMSAEKAAAARKETYLLEMIQRDKPQVFQTDCLEVFTKMREHFPKILILSTDSKGLYAKPTVWDENFTDKPEAQPVELKNPSIFRIVETTQKPFHGPISINEINEKFFQDWNENVIPPHVTVIPLINNDKVIGMLMGLADASAYNKASLQKAEKVAHDFMNKLIPGKIAAA